MTWVDLANLKGPQGDQGPVNVGLRQANPITFAAPGGFTFNFVDGTAQTVNLPIASAQSAGLADAGGRQPSTGVRNVNSLLTGGASGIAWLIRVGSTVTLSLEDISFDGVNPGYGEILRLVQGFRPPFTIRDNWDDPSVAAFVALFPNGGISANRPAGVRLRRDYTFVTQEAWPTALPGTPA